MDATISVYGVMGLAQIVACAFLNDNGACLDMPYEFYNYKLICSLTYNYMQLFVKNYILVHFK